MQNSEKGKAIPESLMRSFETEVVPDFEELREAEKRQIEDTKNTSVD